MCKEEHQHCNMLRQQVRGAEIHKYLQKLIIIVSDVVSISFRRVMTLYS